MLEKRNTGRTESLSFAAVESVKVGPTGKPVGAVS